MSVWMAARRLALAVGGATVVAVLALTLGVGTTGVQAQTPGLNFSMAVEGASGCDTSGGDTTCFIEPDSTFTLTVSLDSMPDGISEYEGFDISIRYSGVTSQNNATFDWPECEFPATNYDDRDGSASILAACALGLDNTSSSYTGVLMRNDFDCTGDGAIRLLHGAETGDTALATPGAERPSETGEETLTIVCGDEPEATAEPTDDEEPQATATEVIDGLPPTGNGIDSSDGGLSAGIWALIAGLVALGVAGLGAIAFRTARGRQAGS